MAKAALLWDDSLLWGVMACKALESLNLAFDLVCAEEIKRDILKSYHILFVPGGWASNRMETLGQDGASKIKEFVFSGNNYFGICGGAGLATKDCLGIINVTRKPSKLRLPSYNGSIRIIPQPHPIFKGLKAEGLFLYVWYPSQFMVEGEEGILATFGAPGPDAFTSDLNILDLEHWHIWKELESSYGINLDPRLLINQPAIIEGSYGKGKVLISLAHVDTPRHRPGLKILENTWEYMGGERKVNGKASKNGKKDKHLKRMEHLVKEIIDVGHRNFLWYWRNPYLLTWRRGIRGLEYCTLYVLIRELVKKGQALYEAISRQRIIGLLDTLETFSKKAKEHIVLERLSLQQGLDLTKTNLYSLLEDTRAELFGTARSHGGFFKSLIKEVEAVLYKAIKATG